MPNPFYQSQNMNSMAGYRNVYNMLVNSKNPAELMNRMIQQNPNMKSIFDMVQASKNPQLMFNELCKQRGINPQEFIRQVTGQ